MFDQISGHHGLAKLTHKINHHTCDGSHGSEMNLKASLIPLTKPFCSCLLLIFSKPLCHLFIFLGMKSLEYKIQTYEKKAVNTEIQNNLIN